MGGVVERARAQAAAGPAKSVRVEAVAGRWCDVVDEDWQLDPFLDKEAWSESVEKSAERRVLIRIPLRAIWKSLPNSFP